MNMLSVITVSLNAAPHIEAAIESVSAQTYPAIEHVIIDGGSSDGTRDIIEKHRDQIGYFASEPDNGIYDAMNKGIKAASGEVLFFLNADDQFCDHTVAEDVMSVFAKHADLEIVYGNLIWDVSGKTTRTKQPATLRREFLARTTILHQTVFARKGLFKTTGVFSEGYRVVGDYEWMLKVFLRDKRHYYYLDRDIAIVGTQGRSSMSNWEDERVEIMRQYFSSYEIIRHRILPMKLRPLARVLSTLTQPFVRRLARMRSSLR